jgi:hypothetical protein
VCVCACVYSRACVSVRDHVMEQRECIPGVLLKVPMETAGEMVGLNSEYNKIL